MFIRIIQANFLLQASVIINIQIIDRVNKKTLGIVSDLVINRKSNCIVGLIGRQNKHKFFINLKQISTLHNSFIEVDQKLLMDQRIFDIYKPSFLTSFKKIIGKQVIGRDSKKIGTLRDIFFSPGCGQIIKMQIANSFWKSIFKKYQHLSSNSKNLVSI